MIIEIDRNIYSDSCISKCIYSFLDNYSFDRRIDDGKELIIVESKSHIGCDEAGFRMLFLERLNDYKLRTIIEDETRNIRTILYAKAFADCEDLSDEEIDI